MVYSVSSDHSRGNRAAATVTGPHVATVIFVVMMLSAASIAFATYLAGSDDASGNTPLALIPELTPAADQALAAPTIDTSTWDDAPIVTAGSVYVIDTMTGEVLYAKNETEERTIASTVKIVTALVVVDHVDLDAEVEIVESDLVDNVVYSNMALIAGDTLTVEQLLTGLLIPSGSDGANSLARYVGAEIDPDSDDPEATFVDAMNAKAEELGLSHSRFSNPDGNDDRDAYSTAQDIAMAGAELLRNPVLAEIVSQPGYSFTSVGSDAYTYSGVSTNKLLNEGVPGVLGIKTGSTEEAGGCLVLAQDLTAGGNPIVIAILGSDLTYVDGYIAVDTRWDDSRLLLEWLETREP